MPENKNDSVNINTISVDRKSSGPVMQLLSAMNPEW